MRTLKFIAIIISLTFLVSCIEKEKYYWGNDYEQELYIYLQGEENSPEKQISSLEKSIQQASNKNIKVPPGMYAHLGLMYQLINDAEKMKFWFNKEKLAYPESSHYINFLLAKKSINQ